MDRQRYMAELSKLLTFMFKEDRAEILQHYNDLLDNAEDEQALLDEFGSPTKLAVTISRTYSREERKLSVDIDSKADSNAEANPAEYVKPDESQFKPITPVQIVSTDEEAVEGRTDNNSDEASYVDIIEEIRREMAEEKGHEYTPIFFENPEPEIKAEPESAELEEAEEPEEAEETSEEISEEEHTEEASGEETEAAESEAEDKPAEEETPVEDEAPVEEAPVIEETAEIEPEPEKKDEETPPEQSIPLYPVYENLPVDGEPEEEEAEAAPAGKLSAGLLILYLIFAIPVGLALLALTLALALVIASCGVAIMAVGGLLVSFAICNLTVFADIMLVIGVALILLGIGVLLLWAGIWFAIVVIRALYRGIVKLGRKICVKEAEL